MARASSKPAPGEASGIGGEAAARAEPVLVIAGPTASGKSALAVGLAEAIGGTVINADSMQVYRELSVLTARPATADLARAPHRLYGTIPASEACSAARWRGMALDAIDAAHAAGSPPIVVGGTGLYIEALLHGLAALPEIAPEIRAEARALHAELGGAAFHARLVTRDPAMAARLAPGDSQRLIRAYEVIAGTGRSLAGWQADQPDPANSANAAGRYRLLRLLPERAALYARIERRVGRMVESGALEEVAALMALGLEPALPAMKALGVPEFMAHLAGEITLADAIARAQQASRNYAKRQFTWFRNRLGAGFAIEAQYSESMRDKIFPEILRFRLTGAH